MSHDQWATLHFEHRQAYWIGSKRTFRQLHGRKDRHQVWEIWVVGDRYFTRHGLLDGKMQETSKKGKLKNQGRANELSPEQDALSEARRLCRKKWDFEGYDEFVGDMNLDKRSGNISVPHLLSALPGSFSLYKPKNNIETDAKKLWKKAQDGHSDILYTLKRNGLAVWVIVHADSSVAIYSRRNRPSHKDEGPMEREDGTLDYSNSIPYSARYPHLIQSVKGLGLPPNSMMSCELVHPGGDTKRHFSHVQGVEKSLTERALELQAEGGWLNLYWWDIPFYQGVDLVTTRTPAQRYDLIHQFMRRVGEHNSADVRHIQPISIMDFNSPTEALAYAEERKLEGWVVVDKNQTYDDKGWNLKGKPDRPPVVAKLKPWFEDDFVAIWDPENGWGTYGKGRHEKNKKVKLPDGSRVIHGGVGSVGLGQYDTKGNLVYICDCSSGMPYEMQSALTQKSFPQVWEVKFAERSYVSEGDKTNALTHPGFVRLRTDKSPKECVNEKL